jgi:large conductance mechanosensitive channel
MTGFKNFLLRGNLIELAVAFIMGGAFATVVTSFTAVIMGLIGKAGGNADFNDYKPGGLPVGTFITALVAFIIVAAVVYFFIVVPYTKARERYFPAEAAGTPEDVQLLTEIRDALVQRNGQP